MKLSDFNFTLPRELIAQTPCEKRDNSNLLVAIPNSDIVKTKFFNIVDYLEESDLMVFNDTKVIKAKLLLQNESGKNIEINLNKELRNNLWQAFAKPSKKLNEGDRFNFDNHSVIIAKKLGSGGIEVSFILDNITIFEFLEKYASIPLPPYIKRLEPSSQDDIKYQTIYAAELGAVAAPTAGLHFTEELLKKIKEKNIEIVFITLHVGAGTFLPVKTDNISDHIMHSEYCSISEDAANRINMAKEMGRRVVSVGTTSLRALESAAINHRIKSGSFETSIFIIPGYQFQIPDLLITNFHLPKSTLFMLVCAFAGYEKMFEIYRFAIENQMKFFSYGDASLLYLESRDSYE